MLKNCINCGAVLHGNKCEYCGTEYSENGITAEFSEKDYTGTIQIGNETFQGYIADMEVNIIPTRCFGRDANGKLQMKKIVKKRKFTVIEI